MINPNQLRTNVIIPALNSLGDSYCSASAINLLMGTCAQESHMGTYIRQLRNGPARGIFQMEPATYFDIVNRYLVNKPTVVNAILRVFGFVELPAADEMTWNLKYAALMCRIKYYMIPEALPDAADVRGMAEYWKKYYNTVNGKGTVEEFMKNYETLVYPS